MALVALARSVAAATIASVVLMIAATIVTVSLTLAIIARGTRQSMGEAGAEVGQGVGHALHLATVVTHREVTLDEIAEHGIEVKRVHFVVADELVLYHALALARSDAVLLGDVLKLTSDRAEDPRLDDNLHAIPGRVIDGRSVGEDVVDEFVVLQGEQNLIVPAGVACKRRI
jgi:hypothetical protein